MEVAVEKSSITLSRKPGDAILIGDDVEIEVVECRGGTVRIRVRAPRNVDVLRKELK